MPVNLKDERVFLNAWKANGYVIKDDLHAIKVPLKDFIEVPDSPVWISKAVTTVVREAIEPMLTIRALYEKINTPSGVSVTIANMQSAADIGPLDVAEGQEYPTMKLDQAGAFATATADKAGIQFFVTDQMKNQSQFDVINMHVKQATFVLGRWLEKKAVNLLLAQGTTSHDNKTPANSVYGTTEGRDAAAVQNGTITIDDLVDAYALLMQQGFRPDTLVVSPLTWSMFLKDPILRHLALSAASLPMFYNMPNGSAGSPMWEDGMGMSGYLDPKIPENMSEVPGDFSMAPNLPQYFPFPLRVVISHFMPIRKETNTRVTDMILCDSRNVGYNIVEEDVMVDQNMDWRREGTIIRLKTKQGYAIANEGKGIAVMKNIAIADQAFFAQPMITPTVDPTAGNALVIDRSTAITFA